MIWVSPPYWVIRSITSESWWAYLFFFILSVLIPLQLMHPILDALDGTPHEWIKKLLFTFNEGSIGKFEALAPLLPQEVCCVFFLSLVSILMRSYLNIANLARKLPFPSSKNMPYGTHRVRIQAKRRQPYDEFRDDRNWDAVACWWGGTLGYEGSEVNTFFLCYVLLSSVALCYSFDLVNKMLTSLFFTA